MSSAEPLGWWTHGGTKRVTAWRRHTSTSLFSCILAIHLYHFTVQQLYLSIIKWSNSKLPEFCKLVIAKYQAQEEGCGNFWFTASWSEVQVKFRLFTATWREAGWEGDGSFVRAEPLTCEIWCYFQVDNVTIGVEFSDILPVSKNCLLCEEALQHTHIGTGSKNLIYFWSGSCLVWLLRSFKALVSVS